LDSHFGLDGAFIGDRGGVARGCSEPWFGTVVNWFGTEDLVLGEGF
jgi:hypothetical protein